MWVKLDDRFPDHPKVRKASLEARWLYIEGLCYSATYLTDGLIPREQVRRLTDSKNPLRTAEELVKVGLWEHSSDGFQVHDFTKYQATKEERQAQLDKDRFRKRRGGFHAESEQNPSDFPGRDGTGRVLDGFRTGREPPGRSKEGSKDLQEEAS